MCVALKAVTLEPNVGPPGLTKHLEGEVPDLPEEPFSSLGQILGWIQAMRQGQVEENRQFLEALKDPSALHQTPVTRRRYGQLPLPVDTADP